MVDQEPATPAAPDGADAPSLAGAWRVDRERSRLGFVVRHLVVSKVRGRFSDFDGRIVIDPDDDVVHVDGELRTVSITTGDVARDQHVRSADVLDVRRWPTMRLHGRILRLGAGAPALDAELTIRDVTRPVRFDLTLGAPSGATAADRLRASAYAVVDRRDFGLRWNAAIEAGGAMVGERVELLLEIEAVRADT